MALTNILRNFVVFVDGFGKVGDGSECVLPKITEKVEEFLGGGMYRPIEVALSGEKLEASFKLTSFDEQVISKAGLYAGQEKSFVFRGSVAHTSGESFSVVARMLAGIKDIDFGTWKVGEKSEIQFMLRVNRYTLHKGDTELLHIDPLNLIERRLGVNQTENDRINLGL
jgi:P2 family phage contractile tail tube protein